VILNGLETDRVAEYGSDRIVMGENERALVIADLQAGSNKVEIIGTRVTPEFGSIAMIVVSGIVASIVLWSKHLQRNRF
jgi:hypothetical protein